LSSREIETRRGGCCLEFGRGRRCETEDEEQKSRVRDGEMRSRNEEERKVGSGRKEDTNLSSDDHL